MHPRKSLQSFTYFSGYGTRNFLHKRHFEFTIVNYSSCQFPWKSQNKPPTVLLLCHFSTEGFFFFFRLLRNIIVFHLNVSETDIFSVGLYLMSSYRVTEGKAEDSINWMCTWIYKYSSGWVSVHMDKFSAQSLNMVICSLNGLDMSLQKHKC